MHGLTGGGWKRSAGHGHRSEAARRGNPGKSGCGTYRRATSPRQSPTLHGRFYRTALNGLLQRINTYLVRWARRKYKRLKSYKKARKWWDGLTARQPRLLAHWAWMTDFRNSF
jgi:hypothetical protein